MSEAWASVLQQVGGAVHIPGTRIRWACGYNGMRCNKTWVSEEWTSELQRQASAGHIADPPPWMGNRWVSGRREAWSRELK